MKKLTRLPVFIALNLLVVFNLGCSGGGNGGLSGSSTDLASRSSGATAGTSKGTDLTGCNYRDTLNMNVRSQVYKTRGGVINDQYERFFIPTILAKYEDVTYRIKFFRWMANTDGSTYLDPTPIEFTLEKKGSFTTYSGPYSEIHWLDLKASLKAQGMLDSDLGSLATVLQAFTLTLNLKQDSLDYDALKVAVYKSDINLPDESFDLLLPAFAAHPSTYSSNHPAILSSLHPFAGTDVGSWDAKHFAGILTGYCF